MRTHAGVHGAYKLQGRYTDATDQRKRFGRDKGTRCAAGKRQSSGHAAYLDRNEARAPLNRTDAGTCGPNEGLRVS